LKLSTLMAFLRTTGKSFHKRTVRTWNELEYLF
jgi:hypothetical protein